MTINLDPVIFRLGSLEIRWYGVLITTGIVVGFALLARRAKREGFDTNDIWMAMIWTVIGGLLGARIVHILDNLSYYIANPRELFGLQIVGLAIYGALAGGVGAFAIYMHVKHLPTLKLLDCGAVAMPVGQAIGKFANVINGDTWGTPTGLPWGVVYTNPNTMLPDNLLGVPTHPAPIYEQLWLVFTAVIVWKARPHLKGDGQAFILYVIMYSVGRFLITFLRVNNPILFGLKQAQLIALAAVVILVPVFLFLGRRAPAAAGARVVDPAAGGSQKATSRPSKKASSAKGKRKR